MGLLLNLIPEIFLTVLFDCVDIFHFAQRVEAEAVIGEGIEDIAVGCACSFKHRFDSFGVARWDYHIRAAVGEN